MKLCRFEIEPQQPRIGLMVEEGIVVDLTAAGVGEMAPLLEAEDVLSRLNSLASENLPRFSLNQIRWLAPVEQQEVWAVGVTYLRSKTARMEESDFSATAYDRVYDAPRPELFFKCLPDKVVASRDSVGIRKDARWNVPEPELALVINSRGQIVGYTIGNDMSARDIEGENLLYLPQAKIYDRACALGPSILTGPDEAAARSWGIHLQIKRASKVVFEGNTSVGQIKRTFHELVSYLFRSQTFPHGAVLLTGTGIVPPDGFTLNVGDHVQISIGDIGILENSVVEV